MTTESTALAGVSVNGVSHAYDELEVLHDIDLAVELGDTLALLGPSGCGKTTLLRVVAGLERPRSGEVTVDGKVVTGVSEWVPPEKRRVGMVFQDWALFPHLTVNANVAYGLSRSERAGPRVIEALEMVGLGDLSERMPNTLSGGQQQRVAVARAIYRGGDAVLGDEPVSAIDPHQAGAVLELLVQRSGTLVLAMHDVQLALKHFGRIVGLREGSMIFDLPSEQVDEGILRALYQAC